MRSRPLLTAALGVAALAAVAAAPMLPDAAAPTASTAVAGADSAVAPRVVVGTADTGINPYHDWFKVDEPAVTQDVLDEFGIDADHVIHVGASLEADRAAGVYDGIVPGEPYWFAGTNLIAQANGSNIPFLPDGSVHGVGVTASIVAGNPDAIVYFAEGSSNIGDVFARPEVDIVTTSFGFATGVPLFDIEGSYDGVVNGGKLYFGATPNDPSLQMNDNASGPWWVVGVAGFQEHSSEGKQVLSGSTPELVADFTQQLPYCQACASEIDDGVSGTSFATPLTAGTISTVLLEARRASGHVGGITGDGLLVDASGVQISNWDLRRAVEQGAYTPATTDYSPGTGLFDLTSAPVVPAGQAAQIGWGAITPDPEHAVVEETLAFLGFGEPTRTKPAATCEFMTAQVLLRMAAWDANPTGGGFGDGAATGNHEYQFC